jgi:predicted MFS family arabinose efflux permease
MIIGGIISAVAPDVYTYAAARFLIGVGFVGWLTN